MSAGVCPRCGVQYVSNKNSESLFFHVIICRLCADEEVNRVKRPWRVHPEMAEHGQKQSGILNY